MPYIHEPPMELTYEVSHDDPLHPDPKVADRMYEIRLSTCEHGCKVYADPWSNVKVVAHNRSFGCEK